MPNGNSSLVTSPDARRSASYGTGSEPLRGNGMKASVMEASVMEAPLIRSSSSKGASDITTHTMNGAVVSSVSGGSADRVAGAQSVLNRSGRQRSTWGPRPGRRSSDR